MRIPSTCVAVVLLALAAAAARAESPSPELAKVIAGAKLGQVTELKNGPAPGTKVIRNPSAELREDGARIAKISVHYSSLRS